MRAPMRPGLDLRLLRLGLAVVILAIGAALGAILYPFGDASAPSPPTELGLPPPSATTVASPAPIPSPTPNPTPEPAVTEVPVPAVTEVLVPVVTEIPVQGPGCGLIVSPETLEILDILEEAKEDHQEWVDYLEAYPYVDPPDDGMTRDERLAREKLWVGRYDQAIQLLQEAYVACSPLMRSGERRN